MKKIIGVLVLFLIASGFVMAQSVTVEWAKVDGKDKVRFTNPLDKPQTIQYTITGEKAASIDVPEKAVVDLVYTGKNVNAKIDVAKVSVAAKPKALPKDAVSTPLSGTAAAPAAAPAAKK
jgi:hypothetical protein